MTSWRDRAACAGQDPSLFYGGATLAAKALCTSCEVRWDCLDAALETEHPPYVYGIWGGILADERRVLLREREDRTPVRCGTMTMMVLHDKAGESCEVCDFLRPRLIAIHRSHHRRYSAAS